MLHHDQTLQNAINERKSIIHDRTNLSKRARRKYLSKLPKHYKKVAIVFTADQDKPTEWRNALTSRPGKTIPANILQNMSQNFEYPQGEEGFDEVRRVTW